MLEMTSVGLEARLTFDKQHIRERIYYREPAAGDHCSSITLHEVQQ